MAAAPHILLVDDSPDELRLLVEALRGCEFRLSVAFDGVQGYERAVARLPDLILLDVRMPRQDGFVTCRQLKANPRTAHVPVIFLSAASDRDERLEGLNAGAVDYVLKPFWPEEVLARIRVHLKYAGAVGAQPAVVPVVAENRPLRSEDEVLVQAAKRYLAEKLAYPPGLQELAQLLGTNEKRLTRAFRKVCGTTVFAYLRGLRMKTAERLLCETSLSIIAISEELGFSSAANFATAFLEYAGSSPSVYRAQNGSATQPEMV
ncbi:response regulator [Parapusillimonas granuli]|uniref:Response regulator n=1 Tax=Parapusillimonas granuli TaxID=380911 RepID=A0A853FVX1_9BURK|nr:response regulator [Parapusillimonas granuli]MBB5214829.1 DNA-binding response OmpR family regulator [Parapusillimonas granuli]MEB2397923.1 response regulator [Alcaligenaceae bacterium]NYT48763.1 response regulator [Parapusillimonas granuli]